MRLDAYRHGVVGLVGLGVGLTQVVGYEIYDWM
jgi:hypothetical protein